MSGIVAAVTLLAVLSMSDGRPIALVCTIGTNLDQPAYERCIAELPARQAEYDAAMRVGTTSRPVVALVGGMMVGLAAHLIVRSRRSAERRRLVGLEKIATR